MADQPKTEPLISFVVPTRNSALTLRRCLESIRDQKGARVEVIVVDNFSDDESFAIALELADQAYQAGPERSAQRNLGATKAQGQAVAFIDSDMVLEDGVAADAVDAFADGSLGALVIPERAFGVGFLASCRAFEKELYLGDATVEAARIFRREAWDATEGYDEGLVGGEDWDLPDRVLQAGWGLGRTQAQVWHDEGRIHLPEVFRKKIYYGRGIATYKSSAGPTVTRPVTRRSLLQWTRLRAKPVQTVGLAALKVTEASGIAVGVVKQRRAQARSAVVQPKVVLLDTASMDFGGGFEQFTMGLASRLQASGAATSVVTPGPVLADLISIGVSGRRLTRSVSPETVRERLGGAALLNAATLSGLRALRQADVVYCKNEPQELLLVRGLIPRRTPVVVGWHSFQVARERRTAGLRTKIYSSGAYRWLIGRATAVHLLHDSQSEFLTDVAGVPAARLEVISNGVHIPPPSDRERGAAFRVLFVGRLIPQKGIDVLLEALPLLPDDGSISVTVVGEGLLEDDVLRAAGRYPFLSFLGFLADVGPAYDNADLLIVPSRWETFSLVRVEAMAHGLMVSVSHGPGMDAAQVPGTPTFPSDDSSALAAAITECRDRWAAAPDVWDAQCEELREMARRESDEIAQTAKLASLLLDQARRA